MYFLIPSFEKYSIFGAQSYKKTLECKNLFVILQKIFNFQWLFLVGTRLFGIKNGYKNIT